MKTQTQLKSPVVYRVKDKTTGRTLGYLVPSNTTVGVNYEVKFVDHKLTCNCKAGQNGMRCCHLRAIEEVMQARREMKAQEQVATPALTPVLTPVATFPVPAAMAEAQAAMELFDRECASKLAAADAYELLAEMRRAVNEVPSFVERPQGVGCEYCGRNHASANCPY